MKIIVILVLFSLTNWLAYTDVSNGNPTSQYTHILSWGPWNGGYKKEDLPAVFLDGKNIGGIYDCNGLLMNLKIGREDNIKIEIPKIVDMRDDKHSPIYSSGNYLIKWREQGALLHFFQGQQEYVLHTLTWSEYLDANGRGKDDLSTAHLVLDGKDIGQMDDALLKLKHTSWEKHTLLQLYSPYAANEGSPAQVVPDGLFDTLDYISANAHIAVEFMPLSKY